MAGNESLDDLFCWTLSVRNGCDATIRERATLAEETRESFLKELLSSCTLNPEQASLFYLATCHRVEVYGFGLDSKRALALWLKDEASKISPKKNFKNGQAVISHLARVTSGLDSEVLGETQVTGQVKEALNWAREAKILKGPLDRALQQALRMAKKIRTQTLIGEGRVSVAHVAIDGLGDVFDDLSTKSALLVGAGSMALQAQERLLQKGIQSITWVNRSAEKLDSFLENRKIIKAAYVDRDRLAWEHDIIVAATSSEEAVFNYKALLAAKSTSRICPETHVFLDLGLPRNVDQHIHEIESFYVRNVDEFKDLASENIEKRKAASLEAEKILESELLDFLRLWNVWEKAPLLKELFASVEAWRELEHPNELLAKNPEIEYIIQNIYAKLMHRLVEELENVGEPLSTQLLEILVRAWRQPDKWPQRKVLQKKG